MKSLILIFIAALFTLVVSTYRAYQEARKSSNKARLKAANAYLKNLKAAQEKAMKDRDQKRANLLETEIGKLKKLYL